MAPAPEEAQEGPALAEASLYAKELMAKDQWKEQRLVLHSEVIAVKGLDSGDFGRLHLSVRWCSGEEEGFDSLELDVRLKHASSDAEDVTAIAPRLLWDNVESAPMSWTLPLDSLPFAVTEGSDNAIDTEQQCVVTSLLQSGKGVWRVQLRWRCGGNTVRCRAPLAIRGVLELLPGHRSTKPLDIPLRSGLQRGLVRANVEELREATRDLSHLDKRRRRAEGRTAEVLKQLKELDKQLLGLPTMDDLRRLEVEVAEECSHRRMVQEELMDLRGRIRVFARVRGPTPQEVGEVPASYSPPGVLCVSRTEISLPTVSPSPRCFDFDLVFGPEAATSSLWEEVWPMVDSVFHQPGSHACMIAYGQTGAGKTFTMEGTAEQPGLIPRTIEHLFLRATSAAPGSRQRHRSSVQLTMLEVYKESIFDLLCPAASSTQSPTLDAKSPRLCIRQENLESSHEVRGLRVECPASAAEALSLFESGKRHRRQGVSERNSTSSRSHCVLTLFIRRFDEVTGSEVLPASVISLVDLAGSERQSTSTALDRARVSEAGSINQSLTALGKVVNACRVRFNSLAETGRGKVHVPYRDSVLTRLLSDSIGGQAKTLILVHVTPHQRDVQESCCSLQFAAKAARVPDRVGAVSPPLCRQDQVRGSGLREPLKPSLAGARLIACH